MEFVGAKSCCGKARNKKIGSEGRGRKIWEARYQEDTGCNGNVWRQLQFWAVTQQAYGGCLLCSDLQQRTIVHILVKNMEARNGGEEKRLTRT